MKLAAIFSNHEVFQGDRPVSLLGVGPSLTLVSRHAWADNSGGANLYNAEGMLTSPFRTDAW